MLGASCGGASPTAAPQTAASPTAGEGGQEAKLDAGLNFVIWSYGVETVQDNIKKFENRNSGVDVSLTDHSWFNYHDVMATRFSTGKPVQVAYSSDHWLREWVSAGWIVPLGEQCSGMRQYMDEFAPYAVEGMTLNDKLYGLPYYADMLIFMYNSGLAEEAGVTKAPETWEELSQQAMKLKEAGVAEHPINIPMKKDDPWAIEIFYSMVYSRGGRMFDDNNNPVFQKSGSAAAKTLQWFRDGLDKGIIDPSLLEVAEPDVVKTMGAGQHIYTVLAKYNLAELNGGDHDQAGNFEMALMPGQEHSTVGFVRFYALTQDAVEAGGDTLQAACDFLHYSGGKTDGEYKVVKRWALEKGLGFAQMPLYDDSEVASTINEWGSVEKERKQAELARVKEGLTPWWGAWDTYARGQITSAIAGQIEPSAALQNMADKWEQLKSDYEG